MMLNALTWLLLSAAPAPTLSVVSTAPPSLERVAGKAEATLAGRLGVPSVDVRSHLKTSGPRCAEELRCLAAAPGLTTPRLLLLRLRPLRGGRIAADLRLIERDTLKVVGRHAAVVEPAGLAEWAETTATRLFTQSQPLAKQPPPSPFAVQPPSPPSSVAKSDEAP